MARQFCAAAAVFSTHAELGDPQLDLGPDRVVEWGTCPAVRIVELGGVHTVVVTFLDTSPQNGIVMVSVNGGAATPYELPGELW